MATTYDSDDELSDASFDEFTRTNVLLGFATKQPTDDTFSQLGGRPTWLDSSSPPPAALARCKVCNDYLALLLQLNGDLPDTFPGHERRLYIFSCRRKTCRRKEGSIRAFRGVRRSTNTATAAAAAAKTALPAATSRQTVQPGTGMGNQLFGVSAPSSASAAVGGNPFSTNKSAAASNPFAAPKPTATAEHEPPPQPDATQSLATTFAEKARLSSPSTDTSTTQPRPEEVERYPSSPSSLPNPYPSFHLDAEYETLDPDRADRLLSDNARIHTDIDAEEGSSASASGGKGGGEGQEDRDAFESSMDRAFQRFADRLAQNSEQVLRYEHRGEALLYSDTDAVGKLLAPHRGGNAKVQVRSGGPAQYPRCTNCGASRVFEVQLTPHAIAELEGEQDMKDAVEEGMEWGTIIVATCERDCSPSSPATALSEGVGAVGYVDEWCGVQWEEVVDFRRVK